MTPASTTLFAKSTECFAISAMALVAICFKDNSGSWRHNKSSGTAPASTQD